jgi:hypothetical protein
MKNTASAEAFLSVAARFTRAHCSGYALCCTDASPLASTFGYDGMTKTFRVHLRPLAETLHLTNRHVCFAVQATNDT